MAGRLDPGRRQGTCLHLGERSRGVDWGKDEVDLVIEATGKFRTPNSWLPTSAGA